MEALNIWRFSAYAPSTTADAIDSGAYHLDWRGSCLIKGSAPVLGMSGGLLLWSLTRARTIWRSLMSIQAVVPIISFVCQSLSRHPLSNLSSLPLGLVYQSCQIVSSVSLVYQSRLSITPLCYPCSYGLAMADRDDALLQALKAINDKLGVLTSRSTNVSVL